ncbi:MAG: isoprenylcysteine carboxylmethyltransferase family protein [Chloroflexi bacterium]|nr:isoprenylcysteine carboxylmethyltransferase family protein [Chloroflexota bacterium]
MEKLFSIDSYAYGMWGVVAINATIFILFTLSFLKPKKRWEWRSMGVFSAFVVALFTEMYGLPLTVYILTAVLGKQYPVTNPFNHINGNLWAVFSGGSVYFSAALMLLGGVMMIAGLVIMGKAWKQLHHANGELVTLGLYRRVRHPQYLGLFLILVGMLTEWPTFITIAMWPILMIMYYRLARREEKEMQSLFNDQYTAYQQQVPMFWPRLATASLTASP